MWEIPIRFPLYVIPSIPFSGSGPNKTRSQAVPRPPAKRNVSDPRPLIPKREGGRTKPYGAYASKYGQAAPGSSWSSVNLWGKVERRSTQALSPVLLRLRQPQKAKKKKTSTGLSFRDAHLVFCAVTFVFFGGFFSPVDITGPVCSTAKHFSFSFGKDIATLRSPYVQPHTPTHSSLRKVPRLSLT